MATATMLEGVGVDIIFEGEEYFDCNNAPDATRLPLGVSSGTCLGLDCEGESGFGLCFNDRWIA